ncbi:UDP-glucuronate:xylan alpha-glucuronosyltransferase 2-like [Dorcoceras hygrometricum]|uniref:UDP-glucuronate:xylan alpha-glucuronosyltransferase 2-like n=1 Tax=Dorcoceras hygrometricum TaxID=472368 RepID=A0A2Z7A801_9LAMI|nr:UDP-glucuronate:xylan alpha-glucuronosyltransferase 2-like [Dorcoceras hygrometricum]
MTAIGRVASTEKDLALVPVAQDAVPIQIVEPISVVPAERPHAKKRKAPKRKLRLSIGADDEIVDKEPDVESVVEQQKEQTTVDDVDNIIEQVLAKTAQMETDLVEIDIFEDIAMGTDLTDMEEDSVKNKETDIQLVETATRKEIDPEPVADVGQIPLDEESLSIDELLKPIHGDMMLPSVIAAEPMKIKFGNYRSRGRGLLPETVTSSSDIATVRGTVTATVFQRIAVQFLYNRYDDVSLSENAIGQILFYRDRYLFEQTWTIHSSSSKIYLSTEKDFRRKRYVDSNSIDYSFWKRSMALTESYKCLELRRQYWYYFWPNSTHLQRSLQRDCTYMEIIVLPPTICDLPYSGAGLTAYDFQKFKRDSISLTELIDR